MCEGMFLCVQKKKKTFSANIHLIHRWTGAVNFAQSSVPASSVRFQFRTIPKHLIKAFIAPSFVDQPTRIFWPETLSTRIFFQKFSSWDENLPKSFSMKRSNKTRWLPSQIKEPFITKKEKESTISSLKITRLNPGKPKAVIRRSHYSLSLNAVCVSIRVCVSVCKWERGRESVHAHRYMLRAAWWDLCRWVIKLRKVCTCVCFVPSSVHILPLCHIWGKKKLHLSLFTRYIHKNMRTQTHAERTDTENHHSIWLKDGWRMRQRNEQKDCQLSTIKMYSEKLAS